MAAIASMPDGSSRSASTQRTQPSAWAQQATAHAAFPLEKKKSTTQSSPEEQNKMGWNNTEQAWKMDCVWEWGERKSWNGGQSEAKSHSLDKLYTAANCKCKLSYEHLWSWLRRVHTWDLNSEFKPWFTTVAGMWMHVGVSSNYRLSVKIYI